MFVLKLMMMLLLSVTSHSAFDPCVRTNHIVLNEMHAEMEINTVFCNKNTILEGYWYRLKSGICTRIAESYQANAQCSPGAPYWLTGQHPTDTKITNTTACTDLSVKGSGVCSKSNVIQMKLCEPTGSSPFSDLDDSNHGDHYYVYKLNAPGICPRVHCSSTGHVCLVDTTYPAAKFAMGTPMNAESDSGSVNMIADVSELGYKNKNGEKLMNITITQNGYDTATVICLIVLTCIVFTTTVKCCKVGKNHNKCDDKMINA